MARGEYRSVPRAASRHLGRTKDELKGAPGFKYDRDTTKWVGIRQERQQRRPKGAQIGRHQAAAEINLVVSDRPARRLRRAGRRNTHLAKGDEPPPPFVPKNQAHAPQALEECKPPDAAQLRVIP